MAQVDRTIDGQKIENAIANDLDVQEAIGSYAFEIKAFADLNLVEARDFSASIGRPTSGDSFVEIEKSAAAWDVILNDDAGDSAAYNIETGRGVEFFDPKTGLPKGDMEGLFLLGDAIDAVADRHRSELRGG